MHVIEGCAHTPSLMFTLRVCVCSLLLHRTNIPVQLMAFPDYPYSFSVPSFPHHSAILQYLRDYVQHFNLRQYIRFRTRVVQVVPVDSGEKWTGWNVSTETVGETPPTKETKVFDAVLVCNG